MLVMADRVVADDPGVHVDAEGLDEDAFCCLWVCVLASAIKVVLFGVRQ